MSPPNSSGATPGPIRPPSLAVGWLASRPGLAWVVLAGGLLGTLAASLAAWEQRRARDELRFVAQTDYMRGAVAEQLNRCLDMLRAAAGLFAASETVQPDEWRRFAEGLGLERNFPAVRALGYAEKLPAAEISQRIENLRRHATENGRPAFAEVWPASNRETCYVVTMVEPLLRNWTALGFDLASDPARRRAADHAAESGEPAMTPRLELVQASGSPGVLMLLAVEPPEKSPPGLRNPGSAPCGWVYAAVVVPDVLAEVERRTGREVVMEVFDGPAASPGAELGRVGPLLVARENDSSKLHQRESRLTCCNRLWTFRFRALSSTGLAAWFAAPGPLGAASLGLCISAMAFMVFRTLSETRTRAEAIARRMTAELQLLNQAVESANDGVFILDAAQPDWPILYTNPAFQRMFEGGPSASRSGHTSLRLCGAPGETNLAVIPAQLKAGSCGHTVLQTRRSDGSVFWAEYSVAPLRNESGQITHYVGIVEDVTIRKEAEEKLSRACLELARIQEVLRAKINELKCSHEDLQRTQDQLIQAAKLESVGTLAASVAHEVKNPLQSILIGLDYLRHRLRDRVDEPTRMVLQDMSDAVKRADFIVRELLHFSANTSFEPHPEDLNAILERSLGLIQPQLCASRSVVIRHLETNLPPVRVDKGRIEQVFINLFLNALQAMSNHGTLIIRTHAVRVDAAAGSDLPPGGLIGRSGTVVIVSVQDTGPGIAAEHLPRVFEPFFTTKPQGLGTGLGLAVAKRILDLHAGWIQAANAPEGGALFTVVLPACDIEPQEPHETHSGCG